MLMVFLISPLTVCSELSGKELVAEMVYSFLLPEVEKETMRRKGKDNVHTRGYID